MKEQKNIMIIDDDTDYLTQMEIILKNQGYNVWTADSQKAGEELFESKKPDLAIVDLMLENKDGGFILSYKLKRKYPDVPVIIASAVTAETGLQFHLETSEDHNWIKADKYLEKGLRPDQIKREIDKLLKI